MTTEQKHIDAISGYQGKTKDQLVDEIKRLRQEIDCLKQKEAVEKNDGKLLSEVEKQFHLVVDNSADAIFITDKQGKYQYVNKAACETLGYSSEELLCMSIADFAAYSYSKNPLENFKKVLEGGHVTREIDMLRKDGTVAHLELNAVLLPNGLIYGSCQDISTRKRLEKWLEESEQRFRMVMQQSPLAIEIYDLEGLQIYVNQAYEELWGFPASHTLNKFNLLKNNEAENTSLMYYIKKAYAGESVIVPEYRLNISDKSGEQEHEGIRWLSTRIYPLKDNNGNVNNIVLTHEDVTDRKNTSEALRESEQKFKAIFYTSPDIFIISKVSNGEFVNVNESFTRFTGYTRNEVIGLTSFDINFWTNADERRMLIRKFQTDGIIENYETSIMCKNESVKTVLISALIIDIKKEPHIITIAKDITDRKKMEDELKNRNAFIETVLDNLPIGLSLNSIDDGKASYMNKKFEEIYGWTKEELKSVSDFFQLVYPNEEYRNEIMNRVLEDMNSGNPDRMHWEGITITAKNNEKKIINAVNIPLLEQNTMVSTVMNVTEQKKAEEKVKQQNIEYQNLNKEYIVQNKALEETVNRFQVINAQLESAIKKAEESDKLKTAFIANISHEIRTPMNGILGFAELLQNPKVTDTQQEHYLDIIRKSGMRMLNIINDLIDISKIESGQAELAISEFSCHDVLKNLHNFFKSEADEKNIALTYKENVPLVEDIICTDKAKLTQVLSNLLNNAIKFTSKGSVEYGYSNKGSRFEFFVKDTGKGISSDLKEKIFERFRQADLMPENSREGTGLGLSISKAYVEMMGGEINVESEEGKGTLFTFTIKSKENL